MILQSRLTMYLICCTIANEKLNNIRKQYNLQEYIKDLQLIIDTKCYAVNIPRSKGYRDGKVECCDNYILFIVSV